MMGGVAPRNERPERCRLFAEFKAAIPDEYDDFKQGQKGRDFLQGGTVLPPLHRVA